MGNLADKLNEYYINGVREVEGPRIAKSLCHQSVLDSKEQDS